MSKDKREVRLFIECLESMQKCLKAMQNYFEAMHNRPKELGVCLKAMQNTLGDATVADTEFV